MVAVVPLPYHWQMCLLLLMAPSNGVDAVFAICSTALAGPTGLAEVWLHGWRLLQLSELPAVLDDIIISHLMISGLCRQQLHLSKTAGEQAKVAVRCMVCSRMLATATNYAAL